MKNANNTIKEAASQQNTETLKKAIRELGGGDVAKDARMIRAAMLDIIFEREGENAFEALCEEINF